MNLHRAGLGFVYVYGFAKDQLTEIQKSFCPCENPGDACGCGEENRFLLAARRPLSPSSLPPGAALSASRLAMGLMAMP